SLELFRRLGFRSGRDGAKLEGIRFRPGTTGAPVLLDALAYVEARVAEWVEAREVTVVVADVVGGERLRDGDRLTIEEVRARLSGDDLDAWDARRAEELRQARALAGAGARP